MWDGKWTQGRQESHLPELRTINLLGFVWSSQESCGKFYAEEGYEYLDGEGI